MYQGHLDDLHADNKHDDQQIQGDSGHSMKRESKDLFVEFIQKQGEGQKIDKPECDRDAFHKKIPVAGELVDKTFGKWSPEDLSDPFRVKNPAPGKQNKT